MQKIEYSVPLIQQTASDKTCGPTALASIYKYFKVPISKQKILKDLNITKQEETYTFQLARHILKSCLKVRGIISHFDYLDPSWKDLEHELLVEKIKDWLVLNFGPDCHHGWSKSALYFLFYLLEGGKVKIETINKKMITKAIQSGNLILTALEESWLWGKRKIEGKAKFDDLKGKVSGHYVVLCGDNGEKFKIVDPYPTGRKGREKEYWINQDDVIGSILTWSGEILIVGKEGQK